MNAKGHVTIRARDNKRWVLDELEKMAKQEQRSISFIAVDILERYFSKKKKQKK